MKIQKFKKIMLVKLVQFKIQYLIFLIMKMNHPKTLAKLIKYKKKIMNLKIKIFKILLAKNHYQQIILKTYV